MDIYQLLKKDHDKLKSMLQRLVDASEINEDTKQLLQQVKDELIPHSRAEEAVFYDALRNIDETEDEAAHGFQEHAKAETLLRSLMAMEKIGADWTKGVKKLQADLEHHIAEEEGEIFMAAKEVLSDSEARQLGDAFRRLKPKVEDQGMMDDTIDLISNLLPDRFAKNFGTRAKLREDSSSQSPAY